MDVEFMAKGDKVLSQYNKIISKQYQSERNKVIINGVNSRLLKMYSSVALNSNAPSTVLDIGCGSGEMLKKFSEEFPNAELYGIDGSEKMLQLAKAELDFNVIQADFTQGLKQLLKMNKKFDCIIISFVCAYVDVSDLLSLVKQLLAPQGKILFASTALSTGFPQMWRYFSKDLKQSINPIRRMISRKFMRLFSSVTVPGSPESIQKYFLANNLQCLCVAQYRNKLVFESKSDILKFFFNSGWSENSVFPLWMQRIVSCMVYLGLIRPPYKDFFVAELYIASDV
jgi:2-polyprenyl-3-methyl-5-hydroxy-6-metoxy-1,4-benzoquinol methylase